MSFSLTGKVAIVTGGNQGLGLEIARNFVQLGASVVLCARDKGLLEEARETLFGISKEGQCIVAITADVSKSDDVSMLAETTLSRLGRIDILVNSAGIYGPMDVIEVVNWSQWVKAIEINLFGSVLMCRGVLPAMKAQRKGKIIQLSGGGATNSMPRFSAYAVSKTAVVRFAETLAEEVQEYGIDVNAIAPGALNTRLLDEVLAAGPDKVGGSFFDKSLKQKESGGVSLNIGAELAAFLASDESDGITGKLISAVWDDWAHWPEHVEELRSSDVYTLRRIVGRERGFEWGDK